MSESAYLYGDEVVLIVTGMPEDAVEIGIGRDLTEARKSLEATPIQSVGPVGSAERAAIGWAHGQGWWDDSDDLVPADELLEPPECECECGCAESATTTDDGGNDVCEACSEYTVHDGSTYCSRIPGGDGDTCHACAETIDWGGIETHGPGVANSRSGTCRCGAWLDKDRGGWGHYSYVSHDEEREQQEEDRELER